MATNKLTDTRCKQIKPTDKAQKISDGQGMYLYVSPKGAKIFRLAYKLNGKEQIKVLGPYPTLSLADARVLRDKFKNDLLMGVDVTVKPAKSIEFRQAWTTYWEGRLDVTAKYRTNALNGLEMHLGALGGMPVALLTRDHILEYLMILDAEQKFVYARRVRLWASMVLSWAKQHGHCKTNVADEIDSKTAFGRKKVKHFAALKLRDVPAFMQRLSLERELQSVLACRFMAYTWVRTKELRQMRWDQIEGDLWRIPETSMKMGREHLVPLSRQALEILDKMKARCRGSVYVFPSDRRIDRPMSENSVLYLLGRIGYQGAMTGHGFRTIGSTWGNEHGYDPDAIETSLAHSADAQDGVRSTYNQAKYLPRRKKMLQDYADWLDAQASAIPAGSQPVPESTVSTPLSAG